LHANGVALRQRGGLLDAVLPQGGELEKNKTD
jgi:hypothetical protein